MDKNAVVAMAGAKHRLSPVEIGEPLCAGIAQTPQEPDQPVPAANSPTRRRIARHDAGLLQARQYGAQAHVLSRDVVEIEAPLGEARLHAQLGDAVAAYQCILELMLAH